MFQKFGANASVQFGVIDIFRNKHGARHLIFSTYVSLTFRHINSVVLELRTKVGSIICYSHTGDRHTDVMTSRVLTSGFDCWSRGHLHMVVLHHPTKFGAGTFIQLGVVHIFQKFKMATAAILDFQVTRIWHILSC